VGYANELNLITMIKINSSGNTDAAFGNNGIKILNLLGTNESISAILVQTDKKIIAAGYKSPGVTDSATIALVRYKADGKSPDSTFGTAGKVIYFNKGISFSSMALQSTGKIIVSGTLYDFDNNTRQNVIFRLNSNGSADNSFGTNYEFVSSSLNLAYQFTNICTLANDGIITCQNLPAENGGYITVTRLTANGFPDNSFGTNGTVTLRIDTANYFANTLVLQPDGKMLISAEQNLGDSITRYVLIRLLANGNFDNGFDSDGIKPLPVNSSFGEGTIPVKLQADGKIVVAATGITYNEAEDEQIATILFRLNSNGSPDLSFNNTGMLTLQGSTLFPGMYLSNFALHQDNSIYLTGEAYSPDSSITFLMRIKTNGTVDTAIDYVNQGRLPVNNNRGIAAITVLPDSTVLLGGDVITGTSNGEDFLLMNYKKLANGYRFTGNGNWTQASNWEGGKVPPAVLPSGSYIYIQPAEGGNCILNTMQYISSGNNIVVAEGKKLVIAGGLIITH
jgi:uncharacterized delta-60 repeat protein